MLKKFLFPINNNNRHRNPRNIIKIKSFRNLACLLEDKTIEKKSSNFKHLERDIIKEKLSFFFFTRKCYLAFGDISLHVTDTTL